MTRSRVQLPPGVHPPFDVYVNGVLQHLGEDYEISEGALVFERSLAKEGSLGAWRWFLGAFGIGTYRQNDAVDVHHEAGGRPMVAHALDIEPAGEDRP